MMIYAGLLQFNQESQCSGRIESILNSYTLPKVIKKGGVTLCYGKRSNKQEIGGTLESSVSLLIGRAFDKVNHCSLEQGDFEKLYFKSHEEILKKIFGTYVYIHVHHDYFEIIVDSSGTLPFYYSVLPDGNILFSSDIEIIFKVLNQKPEYNWEYLCSYLLCGESSANITPFKNMYELPAGCILKIKRNMQEIKPFWNPLISRDQVSTNYPEDAVDILQKTLKPLIEPYKNICVSLSGGLDSSSLIYCLSAIKRKDQKLSAQSHYHPYIQSSNELVYARKVCEETGVELTEVDVSHPLSFTAPKKKLLIRPNKPFSGLSTLAVAEKTFDYIPKDGSSIFLSGHGSDHIFLRPPSKQLIWDYLIDKGLKGFKQQLVGLSNFYRDPGFLILKNNISNLISYVLHRRRDKRHPRNIHNYTPIPKWFNQGLFEQMTSDFKHPIYNLIPSRVLPGKYEQIDGLYDAYASIQGEVEIDNPTYYPFLSEPIVEFALSFPTYELFKKGHDRYPLRQAVSDRFQTDIAWRRSKGQTTGIFQQGLKKNLKYVLSLCTEGQFAKQGLIAKQGLHQAIIRVSNGEMNDLWDVSHLATVELFLKYWELK